MHYVIERQMSAVTEDVTNLRKQKTDLNPVGERDEDPKLSLSLGESW